MLRTLAVSSITWLLVFGSRAVDGSWSLSRRMHCFVDILLRWAIVYFFFVGVLHCVFYRLGSETWLLPTFLDRIGWSYIGHTWTMEWVIGWTRHKIYITETQFQNTTSITASGYPNSHIMG